MPDEEPKKEPENNKKIASTELEELQKKADEYLNSWKRAAADLINYKKEEMERMATLASYAKESILFEVLPIFDSFYLAEKHANKLDLPAGQAGNVGMLEWAKGFSQIKNQIAEFLKKAGIVEIEVMGQKFDPNSMEIVAASAEGSGEPKEEVVVEELQKGYKMGERVLRPAKVKVSK